MRKLTDISLEVIDYQNKDTLPEKMDRIIERIYKEIDNNVYPDNKKLMTKSPYAKELLDVIRKRFNINLNINPDLLLYSPAAIYMYFNNFLVDFDKSEFDRILTESKTIFGNNDYIKLVKAIKKIENEKSSILEKINNKKGYINLKYAKLEGYFKELKCYLLLNPMLLKKQELTPKECTAVILHEIGHAFNGFENHYKLEKINLAIYNITNELNKNNLEKAEYIFKTELASDEEFRKYIETKRQRNDLINHTAMSYLGKIQSQVFNSKYLETASESQADEFASRFNRGAEIVTALEKMYESNYMIIRKNNIAVRSTFVLLEVLMFALLLSLVGGLFPFVVSCFIIYFIVKGDFLSNINMTYDFPTDRFNRIKNSIVNNLKNANLDEETTTMLLEQYTKVNEVIEIFVNNKSLITYLSQYIHPSSMEAKYYIDIQQKLENTLNNSLFVSSAKLRTFNTAYGV